MGRVFGIALGFSLGIGAYTFYYARGTSYLTNDPNACANCHVMQGQLDAWAKSSHHDVAVCNDCHTPHNFVGKWMTKAENGYHHSVAFTSGDFHEPIQIKAKSRDVVEHSCRRCHATVVHMMDFRTDQGTGKTSCLHCHSNVGHL
ncbi:MAG: cytochrome c nitrite reductase small subunit [Lentisphaerae bacterium]|nr:cytochrome c nitrite reductase small subunit [Lentisphaerota bacterium]